MQEGLIECDDPELAGGSDPVRAWLAPDLEAASDLAELSGPAGEVLDALFASEPEAWLRRMPGRETFLWPGRPQWIVKRFWGGEVRDYWYERVRGRVRSPGRR